MQLNSLRHLNRSRRAGFTLIELLAVVVILGILAVFLLPKLLGAEDVVKTENTRGFMVQVQAVLGEYESEHGDYPRSSFTAEQGTPPDTLNLGGEALVVNLWHPDYDGLGLDEERLGNIEGDSSAKQLTSFGNRQLFELHDDWGNPIAYFHRLDYGRTDTYITYDGDTGEEVADNRVLAQMNPQTERYRRPKSFQLISAGSDGRFGTEDDISL